VTRGRRTIWFLAALVLAGVLGLAPNARAVGAPDGGPQLQIVIVGGDYVGSGITADGKIGVSAGRDLPVRLVADGQVVPDVVGTATLVTWVDSTPTTGFGPTAELLVIRVGGGVMLVASRIDTGGGPVTTFSSTPPFQTLSGTWESASGIGSGVIGAGIYDLVVTLTPFLPLRTIGGSIPPFVAGGMLPGPPGQAVAGIGTVHASRNVPVFRTENDAVAGLAGTLTTYSLNQGPEFSGLTAIDFGGVFLLYTCAFPQMPGAIACLVGGSGPVADLSGTMSETAGEFVQGEITGVTPADLVLGLTAGLPASDD
jgi:hypothetical protein